MHSYHLGEIANAALFVREEDFPLLDEEFDSFNADSELYSGNSARPLVLSVENIF